MIQDAPAYLGVGLGPELVRRIGAAGRERPPREARGRPGRDEPLDRAPRAPSSRSGAATAACICSTASAPAPPGSFPASTSIDLARPRLRGRGRGRARARGRALPRDPADARVRDAALDRPLQRVREARARAARRARATPRCARPRPRSATSPWDCSSGISPRLQLDARAASVSTEPLQARRGPARAAAPEPAALDAPRRRDRLGPDRRRARRSRPPRRS